MFFFTWGCPFFGFKSTSCSLNSSQWAILAALASKPNFRRRSRAWMDLAVPGNLLDLPLRMPNIFQSLIPIRNISGTDIPLHKQLQGKNKKNIEIKSCVLLFFSSKKTKEPTL